MSEKICIRYVTFTALLSLAVIITGVALTQFTCFVCMPLFWVLEIYMLLRYPRFVKHHLSPENITILLMWNTRIHLAHLMLDISMGILFFIIAMFGQPLYFLVVAMLFTPYFIVVILSRITAVKSCTPLLQFAVSNHLCTPQTARFYTIMHAIPLLDFGGAILMDMQITKKLNDI